MSFKPPFNIGDVVSNAEMTDAFKVGNMGGVCAALKQLVPWS